MTHDEKCELPETTGGCEPPRLCMCAERAIADLRAEVERLRTEAKAARRQGRIEGACAAISDEFDEWSDDLVMEQALECINNRKWPEDKP